MTKKTELDLAHRLNITNLVENVLRPQVTMMAEDMDEEELS